MSSDRETTRAVRSWLEEGVTQLPDRVLDGVLDQLPTTRQRRAPWWPGWGEPVNRVLQLSLVSVAFAVAALIGINALSGVLNVGGPDVQPGPAPSSPVIEPTLEPTPSGIPEGLLPEGPFVLGHVGDETMTVIIPASGWYASHDGNFLSNAPHEFDFAPEDAGMIGPFTGEIYVPADPCRWSTTMPDTPASTVDEVIAALRSQTARDASQPETITVDGHVGSSIVLRVPDDADFDECDVDLQARFCTLTEDTPGYCHRWQQFSGQIDELWIVDVNGTLVVIDAMWSDATPPGAIAELRAILDSITFGE